MLNGKNTHGPLAALIDHLARQQSDVKNLVEMFLTRKRSAESTYINCFEAPEDQDFEVLANHHVKTVHNAESLCWSLVGDHFNPPVYLPIRAFRGYSSRLWPAVDKLRIFRSSGTNSGPEGRSWACFSDEGLRFYKASCLSAFFGVLENRVLPFSGDFLNMSIISFVPPVEKWPDSSLAQMIQWFGDVWATTYADEVDPTSFGPLLKKSAAAKRPVCIIGTAFHYVNFLDQWLASGFEPFNLPPGSILVETGGTKGKSRAIERTELYSLLAKAFGIGENQIVSEYGMCELASQAWDFARTAAPTISSASSRSFRFPWWVKLAVMTHPSTCSPVGEGALVVQDLARVDLRLLNSVPAIQTEDLAELTPNFDFILKGRVPTAPLKGCSMKAEEPSVNASAQASKIDTTRSSMQGPKIELADLDMSLHAKRVRTWFEELCHDEEASKNLSDELGCEWLAKQARADLMAGNPSQDVDYQRAAKNSCDQINVAKRWLFIAPSSHSLALIHPMMAALILDLDLRIRVPIIAGIPSKKTFLWRAIELAKKHGFTLTVLDSTWRLGPQDLRDGEHVLIFGDDETCHWAQAFAPGRVKSFGSATSVTVASAKDLDSPQICERIIRDQISLCQRGCLSSRMIFVIGGSVEAALGQLTRAVPKEFRSATPSASLLAAKAMELVRLEQLGFRTNQSAWTSKAAAPDVIFACQSTKPETMAATCVDALSRLELVVPILVLPETTQEIDVIKRLPKPLSVRALSVSDVTFQGFEDSQKKAILPNDLRLTRHGNLDAPVFDGTHLGSPFFAGTV